MNSLSELNTHGGQTVVVTDLRKAKIVFESQKVVKDSTISFANGVFTFTVTADLYPFIIEEIINYQTCQPKLYITISPSTLTGTTLTQTLISPVSVAHPNSALEYELSNYTNHEDWRKNLKFTWNLPSNLTDLKLIFLTFKLTWFDELTQIQQEIVWDVYDRYYYYVSALVSKFMPNYEGTRVKFGTSQLVSKFVTGAIQGSANLTSNMVATCSGSVIRNATASFTSSYLTSTASTMVFGAITNLTTKLNQTAIPVRKPFQMKITADSTHNTLKLTVFLEPRVQNWRINYGDGTSASYSDAASITKTYSPGDYTITISDQSNNSVKFDSLYEVSGSNVKKKAFLSWGDGFTNFPVFTATLSNLTDVPEYEPGSSFNFTNATNLNSDNFKYWYPVNSPSSINFSSCTSFNQDISNWNMSGATNLSTAFAGCTSFNQDISKWDVSNVTNMNSMFLNANNFNQPLNNWNVGKVTDMSQMFWDATLFNQPLNNWNVGKVTNMWGMFFNSYENINGFNQDINIWDVSKVTNMVSMFKNNKSFNQPLNNWNVNNVTNMSGMFYNCQTFNQPLNNWNVSKVIIMNSMFQDATSFNQPLNNWNVGNVTDMSNMFYDCQSFNQPLNNWTVGKVNDMSSMFFNAITFDQNISMWKVTQITSKPFAFDQNTPATWTLAEKPRWGV